MLPLSWSGLFHRVKITRYQFFLCATHFMLVKSRQWHWSKSETSVISLLTMGVMSASFNLPLPLRSEKQSASSQTIWQKLFYLNFFFFLHLQTLQFPDLIILLILIFFYNSSYFLRKCKSAAASVTHPCLLIIRHECNYKFF